MNIILSTDRLKIRRIESSDWQSLKAIWESFNASEYSVYDRPHDTDEEFVKKRVAKWAEANTGTEHLFFAICKNDRVIGYCAFNIRENGYEIGYCLHGDFHGKGFAKESISALIDYIKNMGICRFIARTALKNTPSVRLLKSLGFVQTGNESVSFYKDTEGNDIYFEGGIFELS